MRSKKYQDDDISMNIRDGVCSAVTDGYRKVIFLELENFGIY